MKEQTKTHQPNKGKNSMITAVAWRLRDGNPSSFIYRLQTKGADFKSKNKLFQCMKDWTPCGEITHLTQNINDFLFTRAFQNDASWLAWTKSFPYELSELSSTSERTKVLVRGPKTNRKSGNEKPKKTEDNVRKVCTCKKCGQSGHNSRTCRNEKVDVSKITKKTCDVNNTNKKQRMCSFCCEFGHNRQTCPELSENKPQKTTSRKRKRSIGVRKCGKCGQLGHNARTCKNSN